MSTSTIWDAVSSFFGPSKNNARFGELLLQLAQVAVECAAHFKKTGGRDLQAIAGEGINAQVDGREVLVGNLRMMQRLGVALNGLEKEVTRLQAE